MPRASLLLALLGSLAAISFLGCFDDKHDKYPDPADPNRPVVVADRDPGASKPGAVPGYDPAATSSRWGTGGVDTNDGPGGSSAPPSGSASAPPMTSASAAPVGSNKKGAQGVMGGAKPANGAPMPTTVPAPKGGASPAPAAPGGAGK